MSRYQYHSILYLLFSLNYKEYPSNMNNKKNKRYIEIPDINVTVKKGSIYTGSFLRSNSKRWYWIVSFIFTGWIFLKGLNHTIQTYISRINTNNGEILLWWLTFNDIKLHWRSDEILFIYIATKLYCFHSRNGNFT